MKNVIIALMLMGASTFGQLLNPKWEPEIKEPNYLFEEDVFESLRSDFSKYKQLNLQGVDDVFYTEDLGKMTLIPKI